MDFYFTDRKFNLIGIASTSASAPISITADKDVSSIEEASRTFGGTLLFNDENRDVVKSMAAIGNYVLYQDQQGKSMFTTIMEIEHDPKNGEHYFVAEDAGMDLINGLVGPYKATKEMTYAEYFKLFAGDTGFEIRINEISGLKRTLKWEGESMTIRARLISMATQFDNAEIEFSFAISGTQVVNCYVDVRKKIGKDERITLYMNKDVNNIITKANIYDLCTAIMATGGTPEGKNAPINLKGYNYNDPNGRFVLNRTTGVMQDMESLKTWSRLLSNDNTNPNAGHIMRVKSYETTNKKTLANNVVRELEKVSQPIINYETDIANLPENVLIGDTVYLVDEDEKLFLSARVLELTRIYSEDKYTATLGDYLIQEDGINQDLKELAEQLKQSTAYVWIRYADDEDGNGISASSTGKTYIAIKQVLGVPNPSDDPNDYRGLWTKFVGEGIPGKPGEDGQTTYMWLKYADNDKGANMSDDPTGKFYIGMATNKTTATESTNPEDYKWQLVKGDDGKTPVKGVDYFDGVNGQDGRSAYLHIKYSVNSNGTPITDDPVGAKYVGMQVSKNPTPSDNPADYNWSLVKGADGIPGEKGSDGRTSYLHIKYSNDGGKTLTANSGETAGAWLGQYVDFTQDDSTDVTNYAWSLIKGATGKDGVAGKDGVGLVNTQVMYAGSDSGTVKPTTGWTAAVPTLVAGKYLWTETTWLYSDNTGEAGYSVSRIGKDGNTGKDGVAGKDGVGISNTVIEYVGAVSGTSKPTSGWSTTIPTVPQGQYLWTRTTWTYTDGTKEQGYSAALMGPKGEKGEKGNDGLPGKDGVGVKSTEITYALSTSGTAVPTSGWKENVPTLVKGQYLWTRTVWTYTDNSKETGYAVAYVAKDGNSGNDGLPGKDGVGIKSTTVQYVVSSSGTTKPTSGWANAIPAVPEGKFLWTKITWTYTDNTTEIGYSVAKAGEKGNDGKTSYIHTAYANSADGTVDFTREWPRENLIQAEIDGHYYVNADGTKVASNNCNYLEKYFPAKPNDKFTFQYFNDTGKQSADPNSRLIWYDKDKKIVGRTDQLKLTTGTHDIYTVIAPANTVYFNVVFPNYDIPMKLELGSTATPYLPEGETLHYIGTYTDFNEQGSDKPEDYTWVKFVGDNGKDGKDGSNGKDGQSATEVVSGYLTNEAMLVSANPQGAVSSYDNATGQFVVTEGNKTISTGITFAVKSTVSCTASIDVKGNYKVTAMTADLGTIFLTAKYKDITVEKVAIITKAKQGATGNTGSPGKDGKDGEKGATGAPGKDGTNGKDGATGPKGDPTGITVSSTAPSNPYTNQLWKNTGTSGGRIQNATYRWNGSSWELYTFVASNIIADTLSALQANLGDVNAGKITNTGSYTSEGATIDYTTILSGLIEMNWAIKNSNQTGKFIIAPDGIRSESGNADSQLWSWELGGSGFGVSSTNSANGHRKSVKVTSENISMFDSVKSKQYGTVNLFFDDLLQIPETQLTAATDFKIYSSVGINQPTARRSLGRIVTLSGAFKNNTAFKSSASQTAIGYVPDWAQPSSTVNFVVQGSGTNKFMLRVTTNGVIDFGRYGDGNGFGDVSKGSWLNIACVYTTK